MKDAKYLKDDGNEAKDDAEADEDGMDLFKKKTYKNSKSFAHTKGFGRGGGGSRGGRGGGG